MAPTLPCPAPPGSDPESLWRSRQQPGAPALPAAPCSPAGHSRPASPLLGRLQTAQGLLQVHTALQLRPLQLGLGGLQPGLQLERALTHLACCFPVPRAGWLRHSTLSGMGGRAPGVPSWGGVQAEIRGAVDWGLVRGVRLVAIPTAALRLVPQPVEEASHQARRGDVEPDYGHPHGSECAWGPTLPLLPVLEPLSAPSPSSSRGRGHPTVGGPAALRWVWW